MDLLVKQSRVVKNLVELSGPTVATISGVGGTGKTIAMLQTASSFMINAVKEVFFSLIMLRSPLTFNG